MNQITQLKKELQKLVKPGKQVALSRFFKTGPGEYGEGDVFIGVMVPEQRAVAKKYKDLSLSNIQQLLKSKVHEHRLTGLLILVGQFEQAAKEKNVNKQKQIFNFYIKNIRRVNNWDLVDLTAHHIVGGYLFNKDKQLIYKLAKSKHLWSRRIAVVATAHFISHRDFKDILKLAELLLKDEHDLMHKAVGWMLREVGKKDQKVLEKFLNKWAEKMPRTMLRYSIERLPEPKRKYYLNKKS